MGILLGLSLTQLLELPFFLLLKRKSAPELIGWALLNVFTNVAMNLLYSYAFHYSGTFLLLAELLVFIIEPSALFLLDGRSAEGIFAGVMGNAASLAIGMLLSSSLERANADMMVDPHTGETFTAHTTSPVPFILFNADSRYGLRENGVLADIAPTLLELMGLEVPKEMTGKSLLITK